MVLQLKDNRNCRGLLLFLGVHLLVLQPKDNLLRSIYRNIKSQNNFNLKNYQLTNSKTKAYQLKNKSSPTKNNSPPHKLKKSQTKQLINSHTHKLNPKNNASRAGDLSPLPCSIYSANNNLFLRKKCRYRPQQRCNLCE